MTPVSAVPAVTVSAAQMCRSVSWRRGRRDLRERGGRVFGHLPVVCAPPADP